MTSAPTLLIGDATKFSALAVSVLFLVFGLGFLKRVKANPLVNWGGCAKLEAGAKDEELEVALLSVLTHIQKLFFVAGLAQAALGVAAFVLTWLHPGTSVGWFPWIFTVIVALQMFGNFCVHLVQPFPGEKRRDVIIQMILMPGLILATPVVEIILSL